MNGSSFILNKGDLKVKDKIKGDMRVQQTLHVGNPEGNKIWEHADWSLTDKMTS